MVNEPIDAMVIRHLRGTSPVVGCVVHPVRVICAWCKHVMVDLPEDERGISHGICNACYAKVEVV
jgi:hypothetical protein